MPRSHDYNKPITSNAVSGSRSSVYIVNEANGNRANLKDDGATSENSDEDQKERNEHNWRAVAKVFDRMFLVIFGTLIILCTLGFFIVMGLRPWPTASGYKQSIRVVQD